MPPTSLDPDNRRALPEIRRLEPEHVDAAAKLLARAFATSPAYEAILRIDDPARRVRAIERVKRGFVQASVRYEEPSGLWVDGELAAVSLVASPEQYPPRLAAHAWEASGVLTTGPFAALRFLRYELHTGPLHPKEPHAYLFVLGVEPKLQGRGLGKLLLAKMADEADVRGVPCYLETDTETNVRIYTSVGYRVVTEGTVPGIGFRMWTMIRPTRQ
jgi:ribosomal protein S18 acetylase RimI-like enzyme